MALHSIILIKLH